MGLSVVKSGLRSEIVRTETERRTVLAALEMYAHGCIEAIRAMTIAGDEDRRLEFAARYDEARTVTERIAGIG